MDSCKIVSAAAVAVALLGLGSASGATAVEGAGDPHRKSALSLRLIGGSATRLEICGRTRRARVVASGAAVTAHIRVAGTDRHGAGRGSLIVERCADGRFRRVGSESFAIAARPGGVRGHRRRIDTGVAGDFRIRARLPRRGSGRRAITRSTYLRVSESRPGDDSPGRRFTYGGHCTEVQVVVPVFGGAREVAEAVATPFVPLGYPFIASVTVGVANCRSATAGGNPIAPWTGGVAGIPVHPRGSGADLERYWLWHVGDNPELQAGFTTLGLHNAAVPGIRLDVTPGSGFREAAADVPWPGSAYRLAARVADGAPAPLSGTSVFWYQVPQGLIKVVQEIFNGRVLAGNGSVVATPASRLARLVGTSARGLGLLITYEFRGTAELAG